MTRPSFADYASMIIWALCIYLMSWVMGAWEYVLK
jgi:hypothetical protein